jgi:hypothetical protein
LPVFGPGKTVLDIEAIERLLSSEGEDVDACYLANQVPKSDFIAEQYFFAREELDCRRGQELLKGPAASEPFTGAEILGPRHLRLWTTSLRACGGNVVEIYVASGGSAIPTEHRVDGFVFLGLVLFVDTTSVDPKVAQAIVSRLISAEEELLVARGVLLGTIHKVSKADLFGLGSPSMRKDSIGATVVAVWRVISEAEVAIVIVLQESHDSLLPSSRFSIIIAKCFELPTDAVDPPLDQARCLTLRSETPIFGATLFFVQGRANYATTEEKQPISMPPTRWGERPPDAARLAAQPL